MLDLIRTKQPIIHCITNHVVSNFQANGLLALGASPIMGEAHEEVEELALLADAVSLNIGTLNKQTLQSMLLAVKAVNNKGIPIVLDPVGAGATSFRLDAIHQLLEEVEITALRCNVGELAALAGVQWQAKGVDAGEGNVNVMKLAKQIALKYQFIVAVTGEMDIVTDGEKVVEIPYGSPLMSSVTGMGCLLSSVVAAFLAASPANDLVVVSKALHYYAICGERAAQLSKGPGTFQVTFLDELAKPDNLYAGERIHVEEGVLWK